jgi:hypothetical protein
MAAALTQILVPSAGYRFHLADTAGYVPTACNTAAKRRPISDKSRQVFETELNTLVDALTLGEQGSLLS